MRPTIAALCLRPAADRVARRSGVLAVLASLVLGPAIAAAAPAPAEKRPVKDTYHGETVVDDYRWLENWDDSAVQAWSTAQNGHARGVLDAIACREPLRNRLQEIEAAVGVERHDVRAAGGVLFAIKNEPPKQQRMLVTFASLDSFEGERVLVDPNAIDATGSTSIDWYVPSPDGRLVAVSMSSGGSETGDLYIYDVKTGRELENDRVPRVNGGTAGGSMAWRPDGSGFFYTRYPRDGERPAEDMAFYTQVYTHDLGTPTTKDRYEVGSDYPKIAEIFVEVSRDGKWALTNVQNGDGGEFIQDVRTPEGKWIRLSTWEDRVIEAKFGHDNAIYLVSRKGAPMGKVLRLALPDKGTPGEITLAAAKEIVPERADRSIETDFFARAGIYLTPTRLYVQYQAGGPNGLRAFDLSGKPLGEVPGPEISTISGVEPIDGDDLIFEVNSYVQPAAYYRLRTGAKPADAGHAGAVEPTALRVPTPPGMPELAVRREMAVSKDGTKVPVNIVARREFFDLVDQRAKASPETEKLRRELSGGGLTMSEKSEMTASIQGRPFVRAMLPAPTIVNGYGGYGVNETPGFSRSRIAWLEQGGVFVVANIRGGGEFGERWHREGNLTKKQNVFDDFAAAVNHVVERGYTTRDLVAILGGSNGGLLMAATFTQNPDICKAVVSQVGIYDMLRVELSANGAFNITEFGTVKDPEQFRALYAYSPYHHVKDGVRYPSILFTTGANDPRVDPMQSRKMTARLQAASPETMVLLRTSGNTGHGAGTPLSARIDLSADVYSFLFDRLGVTYVPMAKPPRAE